MIAEIPKTKRKPTQAHRNIDPVGFLRERTIIMSIVFSRVKLWTDTGEECELYMGGVPASYDDLNENADFEDFAEQISTSDAKEITAYITTFTEGDGCRNRQVNPILSGSTPPSPRLTLIPSPAGTGSEGVNFPLTTTSANCSA